MQKLSEKYIPSFDGLLLLYRQYGPAAGIPVRANLCLIHGFGMKKVWQEIATSKIATDYNISTGEHSDRYVHVCEAFTKLGFVVHTVDLRGHGYSGGGRGMIWLNFTLTESMMTKHLTDLARSRRRVQSCSSLRYSPVKITSSPCRFRRTLRYQTLPYFRGSPRGPTN